MSGRTFEAGETVRLSEDDGPLVLGTCVSVDFEGSRALEIESEPRGACGDAASEDASTEDAPAAPPAGVSGFSGEDGDWFGFVEMRPDGAEGRWTIGGREFDSTAATRLAEDDGPLTRGTCVSVDFEGSRALEIESEPRGECSAGGS